MLTVRVMRRARSWPGLCATLVLPVARIEPGRKALPLESDTLSITAR
jgi:hypothetical protein